MIISIHQPQFLPWLGYFEKIARSDIFVFLDDVQFKKNEWQNRNRIKTAQGPQWLTVPVQYHFPEEIIEVKINNQIDWKKQHLHSFVANYSKAPHFNEVQALFSDIYRREWEHIVDINLATIETSMRYLGITTPVVRSSTIAVKGTSSERLVSLCRHFNADTYIAGQGGRGYLDERLFAAAGIRLVYQEFAHPGYPQCFGPFLSHMSVIDLLFNSGRESGKILLRNA